MIEQIKAFLRPSNKNIKSDLDVLLGTLGDLETLHDRLEWLVKLLNWIRYKGPTQADPQNETGRIPSARVRFLLMVLDRNPLWKKELARLLRKIVSHISAMEFFTETGIAKEYGFFGELSNRLMQRILPQSALDRDLASLFIALFPDEYDYRWINSMDEPTFERLVSLFAYEVGEDEKDWNRLGRDTEDALLYLVIQSRAIGLAPQILRRLDHANFRESPLFRLVSGAEDFLAAYHSKDVEKFQLQTLLFKELIQKCLMELAGVHKHLEKYGVSINIVYHLARLEAYLKRINSLVDCISLQKLESQYVLRFLSSLIEDNQEIRSIRTLISQNISLLARKVVERSAETGEHYITRTKEEYARMVQGAAGGGMITALTVYLKLLITSLHLPSFLQGASASLNYSASFVAIHLCGFTLGTKQPAMTGPALAEKMREASDEQGREDLVDEVVHLIRSQVASIFGNVCAVVPTVLLMDTMVSFVFGKHLMSVEKANYAFHSVDILGPVIIYAAFTGILLWLSSLTAGWADNWFALRDLRKTLAYNPRITMAFGKLGARRMAVFFEKNMSGLAGNISLGVLLGMMPEIFNFLGVPLDVRHVTLSSGTLAAALPVLGWGMVYEPLFWRSVVGILFTGCLNVSVSFAMAFWVASRATSVPAGEKRAMYKAVWKRFLSHPFTFFFPIGSGVRKAEKLPTKRAH